MNKVLFSISMLMTFSLSCMANEQKSLAPVVLTDIKVDIPIIKGEKPQNMKDDLAICSLLCDLKGISNTNNINKKLYLKSYEKAIIYSSFYCVSG